ncbi:MAG: hypothetical protein DMG15_27045 [Acidobacteria bacterium]|nr:MAG: hypothetical protein DMG16_21225 [Acidobacteriota bacterium]PYS08447.1 MAG: hypothetical protein DMG15_27045 [Acidobacteriota bacterium]
MNAYQLLPGLDLNDDRAGPRAENSSIRGSRTIESNDQINSCRRQNTLFRVRHFMAPEVPEHRDKFG